MKQVLIAAAVLGTAALSPMSAVQAQETPMTNATAYDFSFTSINGDAMSMRDFAGKAVLVVNTASRCGYTPQYEGLQALYNDRSDDGVVVLGVPSNDFGSQELGSEEKIKEFCEVQFGINFPMTERQTVKGSDAHPFYQWAAAQFGDDAVPQWNFHKLVVAADGTITAAFPSSTKPNDAALTKALDEALSR